MKKRAFERVRSSLHLSFSYDNSVYSGVVTDLSENGMRINAHGCCPPYHSRFDVLFPVEGEVLMLPAKVKRLVKQHGSVDAMGVELLNPSMKYLKFVRDLKWESSFVHSKKKDGEASIYTCKSCGHIAFEQLPTECPICSASIENFENNPYAINKPQDPQSLTEFEKNHVPVINISRTIDPAPDNGYNVYVKIGEIGHTMKIDDHITFIDYYLQSSEIKKRCLGRVLLRCDKIQPSVTFYISNVTSANLTVISSCIAHGNWMSQTEIRNA
jgi:superoxide reductase